MVAERILSTGSCFVSQACPLVVFCAGVCKPRDHNPNIFLLHVDNCPTVVEKLAAYRWNFSVMG